VERVAGSFAGSTFSVSGNTLYRLTTPLGTIPGLTQVRMVMGRDYLVTIAPDTGKAFLYQQSGLTAITDPDLGFVSDAFLLNGRVFYLLKDDDQWAFSGINAPDEIDGLAFATAEQKPDRNVRGFTLGPQAIFWGEESMECWQASDDPELPLSFSGKYDVGLLAADSLLTIKGMAFGVGDDRRVYATTGAAPTPISNGTVSERLRLAGDDAQGCTCFPVVRDGKVFYGLNIPGQGTWCFDGKRWLEWGSLGRDTFRVSCGVVSDGEPYLGDAVNGTIWKFGDEQDLDGSDHIIHEVSAYIPPTESPTRLDAVVLNVLRGQGALTEPEVEMCASGNWGRTWTPWMSRGLGRQGQYDGRAVWRRQGLVGPNGRLLRFRTSENLRFVARNVAVNEARP
jgi:hypothetical protein